MRSVISHSRPTRTRRFIRKVRTTTASVPSWPTRIKRIAGRTIKAFFADNVTRLGAALAFYTTVAVAPLLVLSIAVAGLLFKEGADEQVIGQITGLIGPQASTAIKEIRNPIATTAGTMATVIGFGTMIFGAFGVFQHLQDALNAIWRVKPQPKREGWLRFIQRRVFSVATVMMSGFILMVSLIASAALSWVGTTYLSGYVEDYGLPTQVLQAANIGISMVVATILFALIFKLLPDTPIRWRNVWLGAGVTAVLFTVGKTFLGMYLAQSRMTAAYGAAGSIIALLVWCYYAAQIVFLGAEFTRISTLSRGGRDFSALEEPKEKKRCLMPEPAKTG